MEGATSSHTKASMDKVKETDRELMSSMVDVNKDQEDQDRASPMIA